MRYFSPLAAIAVLLGGCSVRDSHIAHEAQHSMIGMSELELESCVGAPDQHSTLGSIDILTYYAQPPTSQGIDVTLPVVGGGVNLTGGGYCHATFTVVNGRVTSVKYTGDNNETLGPQAVCAPILRACLSKSQAAQQATNR